MRYILYLMKDQLVLEEKVILELSGDREVFEYIKYRKWDTNDVMAWMDRVTPETRLDLGSH